MTDIVDEELLLRAQELAEEVAGHRERIAETIVDSRDLPGLTETIAVSVRAKVVRDYIRTVICEPVIKRMYDIAMGTAKFETVTPLGNTLLLPAPPQTQVRAGLGLMGHGLPSTIGLVDDEGNMLPGVFALGPMELDQAREAAHGDRYMGREHAPGGNGLAPMSERIEKGEFEIVELDEGQLQTASEDTAPPPLDPETATPEQKILARRGTRRRS